MNSNAIRKNINKKLESEKFVICVSTFIYRFFLHHYYFIKGFRCVETLQNSYSLSNELEC